MANRPRKVVPRGSTWFSRHFFRRTDSLLNLRGELDPCRFIRTLGRKRKFDPLVLLHNPRVEFLGDIAGQVRGRHERFLEFLRLSQYHMNEYFTVRQNRWTNREA